MKGLDDAATLIGAASASPSPELRTLYCARARLLLAEALEQFTALQRHLDAIEAELVRTGRDPAC